MAISSMRGSARTFSSIFKFNPYHDPKDGRFTSGSGAGNPMIRTEPPPQNTKIAYKVFVARDGKLYPPMVANPDGQATPVGVWLNASEGKMAMNKDGTPVTNTLGRNKVQAGGKGTQGGSGQLAYRPGWHLGEVPEAKQFYVKDKVTGEKKQKKNFVWAECEIAADKDYQQEAMSYGYNKNGKFQHSLAGLPAIPKDGYYTYRTNPDPTTKPWYITGAMKVNRLLTDAETNKILRDHGITPMERDGGELDLKALGFTETDFVKKSIRTFNYFCNVEGSDKTFLNIIKYNPYHDERCRFTSASGGITRMTEVNFGSSTDLKNGKSPQKGYMLVIKDDVARGREIKIPKNLSAEERRAQTKTAISKFIDDNKDVLLDKKANPNKYLGTWLDENTGSLWLDVSTNFTNKRAATKAANEAGEIALWDVKRGESVYLRSEHA